MSLIFPEIDPVAIQLGPLAIRWYALAYLAGILLGWRYCLYLAEKGKDVRPNAQDVDDFLPWTILAIILGGRLGYVLFYNFDIYFADPLEALKIWHGGMAFHGGLLGMMIALVVFPRLKGFSILRLSDLVSAVVPIGLFFGRIANFINGELYGRVTEHPLGMVFPDGGPLPRHPSQLYQAGLEGILLFIVLAVLIHIKGIRQRAGIVTGVFVIGYGCVRIFAEQFRQPDEQLGFFWGGITMGQILSFPMLAFGLGLVLFAIFKKQSETVA